MGAFGAFAGPGPMLWPQGERGTRCLPEQHRNFDFRRMKNSFYLYTFQPNLPDMPRGRPRNLSNYEKAKVRKMRDNLSKHEIKRFDNMNDSSLVKTVHIDTSGRVFVSLDYFDAQMRQIQKIVTDLSG
jgi:hypothetical protein